MSHFRGLGILKIVLGVSKINDVDLKFVWSIYTIERHMTTKKNSKENYFMSSIFKQIGLPYMHNS